MFSHLANSARNILNLIFIGSRSHLEEPTSLSNEAEDMPSTRAGTKRALGESAQATPVKRQRGSKGGKDESPSKRNGKGSHQKLAQEQDNVAISSQDQPLPDIRDFDGDVIKVASTNTSIDGGPVNEHIHSEDESIYATPTSHRPMSSYTTPATHLKTPKTQTKARLPTATTPQSHLSRPRKSAVSNKLFEDLASSPRSVPTPSPRRTQDIYKTEETVGVTQSADVLPIRSSRLDRASSEISSKPLDLHTSQKDEVHEAERSVDEPPQSFAPKQPIGISPGPKSTRIRFDSEEAPAIELATTSSNTVAAAPKPADDEDDDVDDSSEDEAPEAVSTSAAFEAILKIERQAKDLVAQQEAASKEKRKKREERLREQTEARRSKQLQSASKSSESLIDLHNLPALLPQELLDAEPVVRATSPAEAVSKVVANAKNKHLKFLEIAGQEPRDRKLGKKKIRVLTEHNVLLAPKASGNAKSIREQWLKGQRQNDIRGGKKKSKLSIAGKRERREEHSGFLRR